MHGKWQGKAMHVARKWASYCEGNGQVIVRQGMGQGRARGMARQGARPGKEQGNGQCMARLGSSHGPRQGAKHGKASGQSFKEMQVAKQCKGQEAR